MNPAYFIPMSCVVIGTVCMLIGLLLSIVLSAEEDIMSAQKRKVTLYVYIPVLCIVGGLCLAVGCCACCTLQVKSGKNWAECKRKQRSHQVEMGTEDDPPSQQQPIITGYDPRKVHYEI